MATEIKAIIQDIEQIMSSCGVPALALSLISKGELIFSSGFGISDVKEKRKASVDSVFQVGSVSKALTAWGISKLVEEEKLNLDAPVDRYLTRWHLPKSDFDNSQVTLRKVLSHTSGLSVISYYGTKKEKPYTLEESLSGVKIPWYGVRVKRQPGLPGYSGGGYSILQMIIEEVTGVSYAAFMKERILQPLGMNDSSFEAGDYVSHPDFCHGYGVFGKELPMRYFVEKAAAGLYTTLADMTTFALYHTISSNPVLETGSMERMFDKVQRNLFYGLAYKTMKINGRHVISSNGINRGWGAALVSNPYSGDGIVILTNSMNGAHVINKLLYRWYHDVLGISEFIDIMFMSEQARVRTCLIDMMFMLKYGLYY